MTVTAKTMLAVILGLAFALPSAAGTGYRTLLFEDFESISPPGLPSGWTLLNPNGDQGQWGTRLHSGVNWGRQCIRYIGAPGNPANDWFFTSGVGLAAGETYYVKFMTRCTFPGNPFNLQVCAGNAQNPAAMTIVVVNHSVVSEEYVQDGGSFLAPATGTYYLGFHATGAAGVRRLYVDDLDFNTAEEDLALTLAMSRELFQDGTPTYSPGDTVAAVVFLANSGTGSPVMNKRFAIGEWPIRVELDFDVTGPGGPLKCANLYQRMRDPEDTDFSPLEPDSIAGKNVNLQDWFDLRTPGEYTLHVHYRNYFNPSGVGVWMGELVSDPVVIRVQ